MAEITEGMLAEGSRLLRGGESDWRSLVEFNRWAIRNGDALIDAARRSFAYEAFFREHGRVIETALVESDEAASDAAVQAADTAMAALLERLPK